MAVVQLHEALWPNVSKISPLPRMVSILSVSYASSRESIAHVPGSELSAIPPKPSHRVSAYDQQRLESSRY